MKRQIDKTLSRPASRVNCQPNDGNASKKQRYDESLNANKGVSGKNKERNSEKVNSTPVGITQMNQKEADPHKLAQRQKQIDFGKNTIGYDRYLQMVPKDQRKRNVHPSTPDKYAVISKRTWDGRIQAWRRQLHAYDPEPASVSTMASPNPSTKVIESPTIRSPVNAQQPATEMKGTSESLFDDFYEDSKPTRNSDVDEDDLL